VPDPGDRRSGHDGIGTPREARERALALLYEAEAKDEAGTDVVAGLPVEPEPYAAEIVAGVTDHQGEIDDLLRRFAKGWNLERMPAIDRSVLRMSVWELAHTDLPLGVVISEAVELAKRYSTDDSHRFVNGMLSRIADEVRGPATAS
jgi:transcription antitermination protein NusB